MARPVGKPLGARPGIPRGGARLALIDSLRAAAPWQPLRRRESGSATAATALFITKDDLRVRRFEERAGSVTTVGPASKVKPSFSQK